MFFELNLSYPGFTFSAPKVVFALEKLVALPTQ